MLVLATVKSLAISDSFLLSLVGFLVVFIALIALIAVIKAVNVLSERRNADTQIDSDQQENISHAPISADMVPAAGSLGEIDLYDVDEHSAALIMAIVADNLKVSLNTLRFRSIRQIEEVE